MPYIILLNNGSDLDKNKVFISLEEGGFIKLNGKKYSIKNDFKKFSVFNRYRQIYVDAKITLTDGNEFSASIEQGIYDKIDAIIMKGRLPKQF